MKGLKVALIAYAAIQIIQGLILIIAPEWGGEILGFEEGPAYVQNYLALLGISGILVGVFLMIAARDPARNLLWVKYAIALAILMLAGNVYSLIRDFVTFGQAGIELPLMASSPWPFWCFIPGERQMAVSRRPPTKGETRNPPVTGSAMADIGRHHPNLPEQRFVIPVPGPSSSKSNGSLANSAAMCYDDLTGFSSGYQQSVSFPRYGHGLWMTPTLA